MPEAAVAIAPDITLDLILIALCLMGSAFFSAAETAITSLGNLKTKHLIEIANGKSTKHLTLWLDHPSRVISTILIYNNGVNILASVITTKLALDYFDHFALGIATGITTFIIIIFGEITPKSFGKAHPESIGPFSLHIIRLLYKLSFPVVWALSEFAQLVIKTVGSNEETSLRPSITEEELEFLINEGESEGVIEDYKKDMISGVFDFDETKVREIMTPRTDIMAAEKTDTIENVADLAIRSGHSRIPVYDGNIDTIVGIVFAKDLLKNALDKERAGPMTVADIMREPFFVAESRSNIEVFKDLKRNKYHMAIVIDEHGGTAGVVTMEDILEEIVGDIQDEFDAEEAKILEVDKDVYDVAGSVHVSEFLEFFDLDEQILDETEQDVDTIAGLVTQKIGAMPKVGQSTEIGSLNLEVAEISRHRIERLRVNRVIPILPPEEAAAIN
jgi:putative hemolysin